MQGITTALIGQDGLSVAPLDDANVYRFNDLVREMAKRSQVILVTHNKYTMLAQ